MTYRDANIDIDPTSIDWPARQAQAWIPHDVVGGLPINPCERPGRPGRGDLWHWGEGKCADAIVTLDDPCGLRMLLMIERGDGHGWALPGGTLDPGETPADAAVRELTEETGLHLPEDAGWQLLPAPRYVPDPRASDHAWMVTWPARLHLGIQGTYPTVAGADDARQAAWIWADSYDTLAHDLAANFDDGSVFPAHQTLLRAILDTPAAR
ncbi:NUDIX domain-containing protein [Bailinhaonella thermotolerans]|uniref:NUDIX domain-containing protein n=1 Tax=Bailinhaonella thermotolerans TaxID=1070861 RepID=A0A3A4A0F8_9ACTN|nr:NUDIX domain-containing protein [Bailinhaonella thermotolerans]RJL20187.1 NUDIX domain-containing protein [Bailinhaonella thermotolerans]